MSNDILIDTSSTKADQYEQLIPQLEALVSGESNRIANTANVIAAVKYAFNFLWVGIYNVDGDTLVLGPFQGPVACTRIAINKGVCGKCWLQNETIIVDDVDSFPGHIACSSLSKSEIVIPGRDADGCVLFVLDIDSEKESQFDQTDQYYLEKVVHILESFH